MSSDDELITLAMDVEHNLKELHDLMKSRVNNIHFNDLQIFIGEDHSYDTFAGDIYDRWQDQHEDFNEALNLGRVFNKTVWRRPNTIIYTKKSGILNFNYKFFITEMMKLLDKVDFQLSPERLNRRKDGL